MSILSFLSLTLNSVSRAGPPGGGQVVQQADIQNRPSGARGGRISAGRAGTPRAVHQVCSDGEEDGRHEESVQG